MQNISNNVISIGRAVLGLDSMTIRAKYALLSQASLAELIATKILLEQYHSNSHKAIAIIALHIHISTHQTVAA